MSPVMGEPTGRVPWKVKKESLFLDITTYLFSNVKHHEFIPSMLVLVGVPDSSAG